MDVPGLALGSARETGLSDLVVAVRENEEESLRSELNRAPGRRKLAV
jgi:hypothetical protein